MKNKTQIIEKRIASLFGEIGYNKGQFYCYGGSEIVKVVNEFGGVRSILKSRGQTDLIEKLNAIETYMSFLKYENQ
jgi:hypothetical protein